MVPSVSLKVKFQAPSSRRSTRFSPYRTVGECTQTTGTPAEEEEEDGAAAEEDATAADEDGGGALLDGAAAAEEERGAALEDTVAAAEEDRGAEVEGTAAAEEEGGVEEEGAAAEEDATAEEELAVGALDELARAAAEEDGAGADTAPPSYRRMTPASRVTPPEVVVSSSSPVAEVQPQHARAASTARAHRQRDMPGRR